MTQLNYIQGPESWSCPLGHKPENPDNCAHCSNWLKAQVSNLDAEILKVTAEIYLEQMANLHIVEIHDIGNDKLIDDEARSLAKKLVKAHHRDEMFPFDIRVFDSRAEKDWDLVFLARVNIHMETLKEIGYGE